MRSELGRVLSLLTVVPQGSTVVAGLVGKCGDAETWRLHMATGQKQQGRGLMQRVLVLSIRS